jgi:tRNA threonylcarbamoyladenosine modification (KEOPS) complex  Pcc1 subunit
MYLRNYEPELVKRFRKASVLDLSSKPDSKDASLTREAKNPYNGSSEQVFKSLLRPRTKCQDKNRNMSFTKSTAGMTKNQDETIALDVSAKDMSKYYRPDFRSMGNSYSTNVQPDDK